MNYQKTQVNCFWLLIVRYSTSNHTNEPNQCNTTLFSKRNSFSLSTFVIYLFGWLCVCVHLSYQVLSSLPIDKTRSLPSLFCLPNVRIILFVSFSLHFSLSLCVCVYQCISHPSTRSSLNERETQKCDLSVCVCDNYRMSLKYLVTFIWVDRVNLLKWVAVSVNIMFSSFD